MTSEATVPPEMDWLEEHRGTIDLVQLSALAVGDGQQLNQRLENIGFDVHSVTSVTEATERLSTGSAGFALLGIGENLPDDTRRDFINAIRGLHPELPIVDHTPDGNLRLLSNHSLDNMSIDSRLKKLLWYEAYPDWLISQFESDVLDTLEDGFRLQGQPVQIKMKANRGVHNGIISMVHIIGEQVGGRIVLFSTAKVLDALAVGLGLDVSSSERAIDLAGEVANQVAGRFKGNLARRGLRAMIGVPVLLKGKDVFIRHGEGRPALLVEVATNAGPIAVELCLGARLPEAEEQVNSEFAMDAGDCELF